MCASQFGELRNPSGGRDEPCGGFLGAHRSERFGMVLSSRLKRYPPVTGSSMRGFDLVPSELCDSNVAVGGLVSVVHCGRRMLKGSADRTG